MYKRYVDDINIVVRSIPREDGEEQEIDSVTIERVKEIGNKIHESIQLESDVPSKHKENKVPILDVQVWIDEHNNKIMHEYYTKEVASKEVVNMRSAMPLKNKRTIMTQEILRIIMRCSPTMPWPQIAKHISEYMLRMQNSGYPMKIREQVLDSALEAYRRIENDVKVGKRPRYRGREWCKEAREIDRREKQTTWFKGGNKNENEKYKSVIFVQPTPNSTLKKRYEEEIKKTKCKIKVVETAGKSVKEVLQKGYPFERIRCRGDECFMCESGGKGNCRKENITYELVCTREGCGHKYIGESARNAKMRGKEHITALNKRDDNSVLFRHLREIHNGDNLLTNQNTYNNGFIMNVTGYYRSALHRQLAEAVKIENEHSQLINNRNEFRNNNILRAVFTSNTRLRDETTTRV